MTELFTPPRHFSSVVFHRHSNRPVGWLELFYDLVYVATLIQIGNFLSDNVTLTGFAQFLVLLTVVWWSWTGETFYQNRYVVDDLTHRVLVFTQIFAIASMGLSVSGAFGALYVQFTLAYVIARLMLILMYVRAARAHPESRPYTQGFAIGFGIGVAIWVASLFLPADYHWVGWLVGIAVELAIPLVPWMRAQTRRWGTDIHHISERFGIFTIIVLGESFVKVLDEAQGIVIGAEQLVFSTFGLIVLYTLWWLYFSDTAGKVVNFARRVKPIAWVYGHLPLAAGLVAFGVGAKKLFASTYEHPGEPPEPYYRLLYVAALVLYLGALALVDYGLDGNQRRTLFNPALVHIVSAAAVVVVGLTLSEVSATVLVTCLAVLMTAQVIISIYQERNTETEADADAGVKLDHVA